MLLPESKCHTTSFKYSSSYNFGFLSIDVTFSVPEFSVQINDNFKVGDLNYTY